ncbi:MAG: MFS transporter [Actinomycetes bacterium]
MAGVLLALGVGLAAGATAGTYVLALAGLVLIAVAPVRPPDQRQRPPGAWHAELGLGLTVLWRDRLLRRLTLLTAAMNVAWAFWTALFVLYAVAPGPLGLTPPQYGLLLSLVAVGGLLAAPAVDPLARRLGVRTVLILDLVGTALLVAPPAMGLDLLPVAAGAVVAGAGSTVWRAVVATIRQNRVPSHVLGRVYSASRIISWGVLPIGAAAAGVMASSLGVRAALGAASVLAVVLIALFAALMKDHDLDRDYVGSPPRDPAPPARTTAVKEAAPR